MPGLMIFVPVEAGKNSGSAWSEATSRFKVK
jgi:hypothetical protein